MYLEGKLRDRLSPQKSEIPDGEYGLDIFHKPEFVSAYQ
jgi:hypothetical protein